MQQQELSGFSISAPVRPSDKNENNKRIRAEIMMQSNADEYDDMSSNESSSGRNSGGDLDTDDDDVGDVDAASGNINLACNNINVLLNKMNNQSNSMKGVAAQFHLNNQQSLIGINKANADLLESSMLILQRTSSSASSTSTSSSISSATTTTSSFKSDDHLTHTSGSSSSGSAMSNGHQHINDTASSSLCSSTSNMSLLNENHIKALIMSAASCKTSNHNQQQQQQLTNAAETNEQTLASSSAAAIAAAFADQFAYMVRSRSSSLSESSNSSINTSSSKSIESSNDHNVMTFMPSNNNNSNQNSNNLMKQMLNTYQQALNTKQQVPTPFKQQQHQQQHVPIEMKQQLPQINSNIVPLSPNPARKIEQPPQSNQAIKSESAAAAAALQQQIEIRNKLNDVAANNNNNNKSATNTNGQNNLSATSPSNSQINSASSTPCKVCGDEASGFHYGVDSCEGCKGFFRRCITQGMNHQCTNNQQCEMTPFSRNSCQFCRLKKCFAVGMSREASRLGRRPKRPKDDKSSGANNELDNSSSSLFDSNTTPNTTPLKHINPLNNNKTTMSNEQSQTNESNIKDSSLLKLALPPVAAPLVNTDDSKMSNKQPISIKKEQTTNINKPNLPGMQPPFKLDQSPLANKIEADPPVLPLKKEEDTTTAATATNNEYYYLKKLKARQLYNQSNANPPAPSPNQTTTNIEESHDNLIKKALSQNDPKLNYLQSTIGGNKMLPMNQSSVAQQQKETAQQQMQQIEMMTKLIGISDRYTSIERTNELEYMRANIIQSHCHIWPTTLHKIQKRYFERPPIRLPYSPVKTPANSSNIIESQQQQQQQPSDLVWENFVNAIAPLILHVVNYCKLIPGFNQILQHDQVQLLKQGSFEVICVNSFMLVDAQNKLMLTPDMEFLMDSNNIKSMPLGFFMSEVFELGLQVSPLKLSDAEIALFNAILIMNPDRGDLQDKDQVEELQSTLLHVLYKHIKYYRQDCSDLFFKLLKLIPQVQEINRKHSEALNTIKMRQPASNNSYQSNDYLNKSDQMIDSK